MNVNKIKSYLISKRMDINKEYQIRPMISYLKSLNRKYIGAEIGVATGLNAKSMLMNLNINNLYLIDTYSYCDWHYKSTLKNVSKFKKKVMFIRKLSDDACKKLPDYLDFVYIDGDHSYEAVKKDLENYYRLVKKGGIVGGHDFWAHDIGVVEAVLEFAKKHNLVFHGKLTDWWFIK